MRVKPKLGPTLANPWPGAACSSTFSDHLHFCWLHGFPAANVPFSRPHRLRPYPRHKHPNWCHISFISSHSTRTLGPFQSPCFLATPSSIQRRPRPGLSFPRIPSPMQLFMPTRPFLVWGNQISYTGPLALPCRRTRQLLQSLASPDS